jgi:hypothetical protein
MEEEKYCPLVTGRSCNDGCAWHNPNRGEWNPCRLISILDKIWTQLRDINDKFNEYI